MSDVEIISQPTQIVEVIAPGPKGDGVPEGGTTTQVLRKKTDTNFDTEWHTLDKGDVNLGNADNTADIDKPISAATQTALDTKEPNIALGLLSQYWTGAKTWRDLFADVRAATLDGLSVATATVVNSTHTVLQAIGFLQKQVSDNKTTADNHIAATGNVHGMVPADIGLGNVLNVAQIPATEKGAANGVATLDSGGKVPAGQLPSFVDDVLEYATTAAFPTTGETGKIYVAINAATAANPSKQYRWSGTVYSEISPSPGSTDYVPEGATNLYFTVARVRATVLTGLDLTINAAITAADTVLGALGKLQKQITDLITTVSLKANALNAALTGTTTVERLDVGNILKLPEWTTATRPANGRGRIGYNTDLKAYEGYGDGGWSSIGGGAKGAPGNAVFYECDNVITGDYTTPAGKNAGFFGPATVNSGVTVTASDGTVITVV